ncbi:MAG: hypothetical protein II778_06325, partial [Anaerovibrio sp.]|nr:hypothetical protein [Anaerovibrio sp.]
TSICTSGGSDIGTSGEYLKKLTFAKFKVNHAQATWKQGKVFSPQASAEEIKSWFNGLGF